MKLSLLIVFFLFSGITSIAQRADANRPPKVSGPVKAITYKYFSYTFNREGTRIDQSVPNGRNIVWLFTAERRLMSSEIFEKDGRASGSKSIYNYDSQGRLISMVDYLFGSLSYTETFTYPGERLVKITRILEPRKSRVTEIDEYDQSGNITKATFHDEEGTQTELYKYDKKGNRTLFITLDGTGRQLIKETYKFEFDSYRNWTTEYIETSADPSLGITPKITITRKISYY